MFWRRSRTLRVSVVLPDWRDDSVDLFCLVVPARGRTILATLFASEFAMILLMCLPFYVRSTELGL